MKRARMMKWKATLALIVVYLAVIMSWDWIWGVLFLMWTLPAFYTRRTYLIEEVERDENPLLFWCIIGSWIFLSVYMIAADVLT